MNFSQWLQIEFALTLTFVLCGCAVTNSSVSQSTVSPGNKVFTPERVAQLNANPPPYWDAQREFHPVHSTWGYIKRPDQEWSEALLVMLNEDTLPAPHRKLPRRDSDHLQRYRFYGYFDSEPAYEPFLNKLFDVFVLTGYEKSEVGEELRLVEKSDAGITSSFTRQTHMRDRSTSLHRYSVEDIE